MQPPRAYLNADYASSKYWSMSTSSSASRAGTSRPPQQPVYRDEQPRKRRRLQQGLRPDRAVEHWQTTPEWHEHMRHDHTEGTAWRLDDAPTSSLLGISIEALQMSSLMHTTDTVSISTSAPLTYPSAAVKPQRTVMKHDPVAPSSCDKLESPTMNAGQALKADGCSQATGVHNVKAANMHVELLTDEDFVELAESSQESLPGSVQGSREPPIPDSARAS